MRSLPGSCGWEGKRDWGGGSSRQGRHTVLSPRRWPEPQINRALPLDRGVSFGTVTLHKAPQKMRCSLRSPPSTSPLESPNNLCDCNTHRCSSVQAKGFQASNRTKLLFDSCLKFTLTASFPVSLFNPTLITLCLQS